MNLPNPFKQVYTIGILSEFDNQISNLWAEVIREYKKQPNDCFDGGNDKRFFTVNFENKKLFVAENEVGGLTVMLPEEY